MHCPQRPEKVWRSPGTGVPDSCESHVGSGCWTPSSGRTSSALTCWAVFPAAGTLYFTSSFFNFYFLNKQWAKPTFFSEKIWNASWICIFSVCRGHANFSVAPILVCVLPKQATEHFLEALLITFSFWNRASRILGCPWTCDIAKNDLAFLTFSAPTSWVLDYISVLHTADFTQWWKSNLGLHVCWASTHPWRLGHSLCKSMEINEYQCKMF